MKAHVKRPPSPTRETRPVIVTLRQPGIYKGNGPLSSFVGMRMENNQLVIRGKYFEGMHKASTCGTGAAGVVASVKTTISTFWYQEDPWLPWELGMKFEFWVNVNSGHETDLYWYRSTYMYRDEHFEYDTLTAGDFYCDYYCFEPAGDPSAATIEANDPDGGNRLECEVENVPPAPLPASCTDP